MVEHVRKQGLTTPEPEAKPRRRRDEDLLLVRGEVAVGRCPAEAKTPLVGKARGEPHAGGVDGVDRERAAPVAGRSGGGRQRHRDGRLQPRDPSVARAEAQIPEIEIRGRAVQLQAVAQRELVGEYVVRSQVPLGDVEAEEVMVPVEKPVEKAGVRPLRAGIAEQKELGAEVPSDGQLEAQELPIQEVARPRLGQVEFDGAAVVEPDVEAQVTRLGLPIWLEVEAAPGLGDGVDRRVLGQPLGGRRWRSGWSGRAPEEASGGRAGTPEDSYPPAGGTPP